MYKNVGTSYCNSGLALEVGLLTQWSVVAGFTVYIICKVTTATTQYNQI